ncbi:hypothetical protein SOASR030_21070 [Leminorella grimontii]|uniref:HEAT repeat domain-containing protein n=1 Tax=Leminorella grimontii TaxID=82981 RepID=A0AAV5N1J8_9GAMM|nr:hypothetical protein [Leminorella grimontii]KFC96848.1 hypothetical protein GLGR_0847 [Leminorella grimontii ATCC 33999 = DSM 5078]GKX55995.1 hypothetical protein SOASR030_21070 [Leminorella grimontii]VFS57636.1 Uncharacterised protein [Leminorella grimontii]
MISTPDEFIKLINSNCPNEYNLAGRKEAPVPVWLELIKGYPDMRVWVARNRTIPREIMDYLSKDDNPVVREAISAKYPLDVDMYLLFSRDPDEGIRARLIFNKGLPVFILKHMAENDPSDFVREKALEKYMQIKLGA